MFSGNAAHIKMSQSHRNVLFLFAGLRLIDLEETLEKSANVPGDILRHVCYVARSAKQWGLKHAHSEQTGFIADTIIIFERIVY